MYFGPILLLALSYMYFKRNENNDNKGRASNTEISPDDKLKSLAESEYIGEYQEENAVNDEEYAPFLKEEEHIPFPGARITLEGGAAKFYDIANDRRSVRKYSTRKVDIKVIEKCIQAAGDILKF